jgi:hypothetical protein
MLSISRRIIVRKGGAMKIRMFIFNLMVFAVAGLLWAGAPVRPDDVPGEIVFKDIKYIKIPGI